jgi:protein-S-isoprenylcysteine O-methyltransferase Ste14
MLAIVMGLLLFVCAGTVHYWQAWVYLSIFTGASALTTIFLLRNDRALLERRMSGGPTAENRPVQKFIMLCTSIGFMALLVVPAFDHRFGWSAVPLAGVVAGDALVAIGFCLIFLVYRENTFTSATIEVAENQKVISSGPYSIVRHPMYAAALLMFAGTPLLLGSWWGLLFVPVGAVGIGIRAVGEERMLSQELSGYEEYTRHVRFRMVPGLW